MALCCHVKKPSQTRRTLPISTPRNDCRVKVEGPTVAATERCRRFVVLRAGDMAGVTSRRDATKVMPAPARASGPMLAKYWKKKTQKNPSTGNNKKRKYAAEKKPARPKPAPKSHNAMKPASAPSKGR